MMSSTTDVEYLISNSLNQTCSYITKHIQSRPDQTVKYFCSVFFGLCLEINQPLVNSQSCLKLLSRRLEPIY